MQSTFRHGATSAFSSAPLWPEDPCARKPSSNATMVSRRPSISRAILAHNRNRKDHFADGIVVTPSHNPPVDGGFKYNPPEGGPADTDITDWMQQRANDLLRAR